jgi:phage terminase large subunit-like protein
VNIIGATSDDARDIMIEGESGILAVCNTAERPVYRSQRACLDWPNGAKSLIFTADAPERLRGKQHMKLWADELGAWRYAEAWDQAMMGLRLGDNPQAVITTTPRPRPVLLELLQQPGVVKTQGTTYDNRLNLAEQFFEQIITKYEGTRIGRQELNAEILLDNPGALWKRQWIDDARVIQAPDLARIVVGVDPSASSGGDACGIVVAGATRAREAELYILEDATLQASPEAWARAAVTAYHKYKADRIVAEANQGGEMVTAVLRQIDRNVPVKLVHATRGKAIRAEPVSAVYEQGRGHHVGAFPLLEDELCQWEAGDPSPNRLDALVWAATELLAPQGVLVGKPLESPRRV